MDYDNDGTLDFISGSYDPGDTYLFKGRGKGQYAAGEKIVDKNRVPIVHHPKALAKYERLKSDKSASESESIQARIASFGSWVATVDWEADGDLDLLIGSFSGGMFLRVNEGTRGTPAYSPESITVHANGEPLKVYCHAAPAVADWDGDGLWDLVVGSGDGSVVWYRNVGTAKKPKLSSRSLLVPAKSDSKFLQQYLEPGEQPAPAVRAQICVTDYNLDGRPDLIVGDYSSVVPLRKLDAAERREFDSLLAQEADLQLKMREAGYGTPTAKKLEPELTAISNQKKSFHLEGTKPKSRSFIWLYVRE